MSAAVPASMIASKTQRSTNSVRSSDLCEFRCEVGVVVKKGSVDEGDPEQHDHYVDGLAGATITSKGVTEGVERDLRSFQAYLSKN